MICLRFICLAMLLASPFAAIAAQQPQQWHTSNGVAVLFLETHDLPIVDIRIGFRAGSSRDGKQPGISNLLNGLLIEGSGDLSAQDIALQFERVGAQLANQSGLDIARVSLRSLSESSKLEPVVDLLSRVIAFPSFPQDALERDRKAMLIGLAEQQNNIGSLLSKTFMTNLYAGHPYENASIVSELSLKSITREDLMRFHSTYYVTSNASLAIVGDLSLSEAKRYAEKVVRHLPGGKPAEPLPPPAATRARTIRVAFDSPQTQVQVGLPVIDRHDADYFALILGNHIFGGNGSNSRLMQKIREEQGLSYSVYSGLTPLEVAGPFEMGLQTSNHQLEQALELLHRLLQTFIDEGPTEDELEKAKKHIVGGFPLRFDSNRKLLNQLSVIGFYRLPTDYLDRYVERIQAISVDDIRRVFQARIEPDKMIQVIVGPDPGNVKE